MLFTPHTQIDQQVTQQIKQLTAVVKKLTQKMDVSAPSSIPTLSLEGWISNERLMMQFGICRKTAYNWRKAGLPYRQRNRQIFYHETEVAAFLDSFLRNG